MRWLSWGVFGWIVLSGGATVATGQTTVGPVTTTAISGYNAAELTWLAVGEGPFGINEVSWWEDSDKPCFMRIGVRTLKEPASFGGQQQIDICNPGLVDYFVGTETKTVTFQSNPRHVVRGVAACTNNKDNHRLKGVRIYAAKVWTTSEQVEELSVSDQEDRPNCATWHRAVYCPVDQIASALVVHHSDKEITGLALRCRKVEY